MRILLFFYIILTLVISGQMLFDGLIFGGAALLVGSLLGFAGGSGMRGAFYLGRRTSAVVIGIALVVGGMAFVYYRGITVGLFGSTVPGDLWVFLGFALGFFAARTEDAGVPINAGLAEDDVALGTIAPIAADLVAGRLTREEAETQVRNSALIAPQALALWQSMSAKDREELGRNFMALAANPEFAARMRKQLEPIMEADPERFEQWFAKKRDELGRRGG